MGQDNEQQRREQRLVGTEISLLLAELTINHGLDFDDTIELCRNALACSYRGDYPEGVEETKTQRLVTTELYLAIAGLAIKHNIKDNDALHKYIANALYKAYWGAAPEGAQGPIVEVD